MAIDEQNMIDDPEKRERLKKMVEGLDSKGMDRAMNAIVNYGGGGSTYKMYGDVDPKDIDFQKTYSKDGVTLGKGTFEGMGHSGADEWANLLVDTANTMGITPPEKFWFDDKVYNLSAVEVPVYSTEEYTVQVPNPAYQAPAPPSKEPERDPEREPEAQYSRDYLRWLDSNRIRVSEAGDRRLQEQFQKETGGSALARQETPRFTQDYLRWVSQFVKDPAMFGDKRYLADYERQTRKNPYEASKEPVREPVKDPVKDPGKTPAQEPQFLTETRTRQVQSGTKWQLSDQDNIESDVF